MSQSETINFLFKTKYVKIIQFFLARPNSEFYVNELVQETKVSPKILCESLKELQEKGILNQKKQANSLYYSLNKKNPIVEVLKKMVKPASYKDAGVDIDKANEAVNRIKKYVKQTYTKGVLSDVGSFGGMYELDDNVLTASTDGVGTKLKIAYLMNKHDTIGQDLVNHCVNDILVQGASPLFFLDYIGSGKVNPDVIEDIVKGLAKACKENNCALIGGEVAELPGIYKPGEYDLASFIVGKVKKKDIIDGSTIKPGDVVMGLSSNGLHTNGYSLVIKLLLDQAQYSLNKKYGAVKCTLGEELLKVHQSYLKPVQELKDKMKIKGMAHITGGGLVENIPRILPDNCDVTLDSTSWKTLPIFDLIQEVGHIEQGEMYRVFNMGIGYVIILDESDVESALKMLKKYSFSSQVIGKVVKGSKKVQFV